MEVSEIADLAERLLEAYRDILIFDPFIKTTIEVSDGEFVSELATDKSPLSWIIKLNPSRHEDVYDIQYSIVESLLKILFEREKEEHENIVGRLALAICNMHAENDDEETTDEYDEYEDD